LAGVPGEQVTAWLREIARDPASPVATAAIQALRDRGVTDLPAPPAPQLTFSPYRERTFAADPQVHLLTTRGEIVLRLFPRAAPIHVANLVGFVEDGRYDGLPIHRVVPNFVIQGGDPDRTGWGDAGWSLRAEINPLPFDRGAVGMPRGADFDSGGVQFFINHVPTPHLDGLYTVFGRVETGLDVVDRVERGDVVLRAWVTANGR
jgi:peptidylprolyl isomerase